MKLIILFNPSAGRGKGRRILAEALEALRCRKVDFSVRESRSAQHLQELAGQACRERPDAIVSAGGDGTHHYIFNALARGNIPLGLLPLGSGNDFAEGIGVPREARAAVDVLLNGRVREIDLARVGGAVFGCLAGAGFDSVVTRYANERVRRLHGSMAYAWALLRCMRSYRPEPLELESDGRNYSGDVLFAVVGNSVSYGGGLKLTPRARLDDGLLDVCIVPYMGRLELLRWVPSAYRGRHLNHSRIIYFQTRRITLRSASRLELFGDGEFMQELPATIEVAPHALRVLVPSRA